MNKILLGTQNSGKIQEIQEFFHPRTPWIQFVSLKDIESSMEVRENGSSFLENAQIKAKTYSNATGLPCLADDSGLEVDALDGKPGVLSARFAGPNATDEENIQKLLIELQGIDSKHRTARFVCSMVLVFPNQSEMISIGKIEGTILEKPQGTQGFGYDPVFYVSELKKTFAELTLNEKNKISHRAQALEEISIQLNLFSPSNFEPS